MCGVMDSIQKRAAFVSFVLCGFCAFTAISTSSFAAGVSIERSNSSEALTVRIENAKVEEALGKLAEVFEFEFVGATADAPSARGSAILSGTLNSILDRLLRNRNHMIVRAPGAPSKIRRVILIDALVGSKPVRSRPPYRDKRMIAKGAKRVSANGSR